MSGTARRLDRPGGELPGWCRSAITLERIERLGVHGCFWLHFFDSAGRVVHAAGGMPGSDRSVHECIGRGLEQLFPPECVAERREVFESVLGHPGHPTMTIDMWGGRETWTLCEVEGADDGHLGVLAIGYRPCVEQAVPTDVDVHRYRRVVDPGPLRRLSLGEIEVLRLLSLGYSREDMAHLVHRTVKAVERRRTTLGRKLGLGSSHMLALTGLRAGLHRFDEGELESFWRANCNDRHVWHA